jgi:CBS domain-containing protein
MKIGEIRKLRSGELQTITAEETVHCAVKKLAGNNIGALPVRDQHGQLVGIITERDVLRLVAADDAQAALQKKVAAVMTRNLVVSELSDDIEYAMHVMTDKRIRHLPILVDGQLVDILSIGDVVKSKLEVTDEENRFLRNYVANGTG